VDTNGYVAFLMLGVALVALDAAIVYRSGRAYLDDAYRDPRASRSMVQLVTVLFCLVVLGLLAIISSIDIDTGNQVQTVVVKLGVVLLVLAAAHGATMTILSRVRDRLREQQLTDELVDRGPVANPTTDPTTPPTGWQTSATNGTAIPEDPSRHPAVSPPIEEGNPYSSPTS
jgi:protein-S-isoprenylcysteine O-methyltransferase Ste14